MFFDLASVGQSRVVWYTFPLFTQYTVPYCFFWAVVLVVVGFAFLTVVFLVVFFAAAVVATVVVVVVVVVVVIVVVVVGVVVVVVVVVGSVVVVAGVVWIISAAELAETSSSFPKTPDIPQQQQLKVKIHATARISVVVGVSLLPEIAGKLTFRFFSFSIN